MAEPRFKVVNDSRHSCCMDWSVQDTTKPRMIGGEHWRDPSTGELDYVTVCECYEEADAKMVAEALNAREAT